MVIELIMIIDFSLHSHIQIETLASIPFVPFPVPAYDVRFLFCTCKKTWTAFFYFFFLKTCKYYRLIVAEINQNIYPNFQLCQPYENLLTAHKDVYEANHTFTIYKHSLYLHVGGVGGVQLSPGSDKHAWKGS